MKTDKWFWKEERGNTCTGAGVEVEFSIEDLNRPLFVLSVPRTAF
jgi:hypothetical protein